MARLLQKPLLTEMFKTFLNSTLIHNGRAAGNVGASLFETLSESFRTWVEMFIQRNKQL
jgi:hypothetical protein